MPRCPVCPPRAVADQPDLLRALVDGLALRVVRVSNSPSRLPASVRARPRSAVLAASAAIGSSCVAADRLAADGFEASA
jgi:hypothetical protein